MRWSAAAHTARSRTATSGRVYPGRAKTSLYAGTRRRAATHVVSVTDPLANVRFDPDMKPTYTDSYSIGFDRELKANMAIGATYVHKRGENYIGSTDIGGIYGERTDMLPDGRTVTVFPLLNSPKLADLHADQRRGHVHEIQRAGPHARQTLLEPMARECRVHAQQRHRHDITGQDPNDQVNNVGGLSPQDRPNMVVSTGMYDIPGIGTQLAISFMSMAGGPTRRRRRSDLPQGRRSVNIDAPGSYRYTHRTSSACGPPRFCSKPARTGCGSMWCSTTRCRTPAHRVL